MAAKAPTPATVNRVRTRDGDRCAKCGRVVAHLVRGIAWSIHHRRPRGSGGTTLAWVNLPANLLILCGSGTTGCHGWVESHRDEARHLGFLVTLNGRDTSVTVAVTHAVHGRVVLDDIGGHEPEETEVTTGRTSP